MMKNRRHKHGEGCSIDLYAYASNIRNWSASFKAGFSFLLMCLSIVLDHPYVSVVIIIAMGYITVVKGGLSLAEYLWILAIPFTFILLGTIPIALEITRAPVGQYHIKLGFCYLNTSLVQLRQMLHLTGKVLAAVSALQMMTLSTPSSEIITVFQKAHVPKLLIELMHLMYRFIFILLDVHGQMKHAAKARHGYCDFKTACFTFGNIASTMLIVAMKRADTYYNAMEARCYDGELLFWEEKREIKWSQRIIAATFILFLLLVWRFL